MAVGVEHGQALAEDVRAFEGGKGRQRVAGRAIGRSQGGVNGTAQGAAYACCS